MNCRWALVDTGPDSAICFRHLETATSPKLLEPEERCLKKVLQAGLLGDLSVSITCGALALPYVSLSAALARRPDPRSTE